MYGRAWLQLFNVLLYGGTLYLLILLAMRGALSLAAMIAPASFFVHAIIFYAVVLIFDISDYSETMTTWSAGIRLHGAIIALAIVAALVKQSNKNNAGY